MADYNIYIHSAGQNDSPTSPIQLRDNSDISGAGGEGPNGSGFGSVRRAASFLTNPDTAIGQVSGFIAASMGKLLPFAILSSVVGLAKTVMNSYVPFAASATGDYAFQIKYNNFFQDLHNATHPFSTYVQSTKTRLELRKQNAKDEQQRLLFGGTIYTDHYGRNL